MKLTLKELDEHLIIRILSLPALAFIGCLLIKMTTTLDEFLSFVRAYKGAGVFSLIMAMTHVTQELITVLEDYIPNPTKREKGIKIILFLSVVSVVIIGIALWRI